MTVLWKATREGGQAAHGYGRWHPRRWRTVSGALIPCRRGIHYAAGPQILRWLNTELWVFEDGSPEDAIDAGDKIVTRRGRVLERVQAWTPQAATEMAYYAADRAVQVHAVAALRTAGLTEQADTLAALPEIVDRGTAGAASYAARAASDAAQVARPTYRAASYAARAASYAAPAASFDNYAARAAGNAAGAASDAARAASYAAGAASDAARAAEREHLYEWLLTRLGWTP